MKATALSLSLSVALASPAMAMLTPSEKESVRRAQAAAVAVAHADRFAADALGLAPGAARPALAAAVRMLSRTERDEAAIYYGLLGGLSQDKARTDQLVDVWAHLDRALTDTLPSAAAALDRARSACGTPCQETLFLAAQSVREDTISQLQRVDRTLAYADPSPQGLLAGQTIPAVIGPHGDYARAARHSYEGTGYALDWIDEGVLPLLRGLPAVAIPSFKEPLTLYAYALELQYVAFGRTSAVTPATDQFCSVLKADAFLTDAREGGVSTGAAELLMDLAVSWAPMSELVAQVDDRSTRLTLAYAHGRAHIRFADWWANSIDATHWSMFRFRNAPQTTRCGS